MKSSIQIHCKYDELKDPFELKDHKNNRNMHGDDQIERLAELYKYHGVRHPIIVSTLTDCIVAGHGRKLAAIRAGIKEMPVVFQDFESSEAEYAFIQADNAIASWSELDLKGINTDLADLGPDFDINMLGIQGFTLDVAEKTFEGDPDDVPEDVEPQAKLGQIYKLGEHRLMCGDSTDEEMISKLMDDNKADMVFTSPPYGVGLDYNSYDDSFQNTLSVVKKVITTVSNFTYGYIALNWCDIVSGNKINRSEHPSQFSWLPVYDKTLNDLGFYLWAQRIWKKPHARVSAPWAASSNRNVTDWEYLFTWSNGKQRSNKRQNESHFGIIDSSESKQADTLKDHPGAFPVFVAERMVSIHTDPGFSVLDPFGGSGSTLIACEKTNRKCFMMELDPHYVDVIIARWEKFTGQKAELLSE